ncbi:MAG: AAA family ATPase [Thaumarchaeota archaeon]|nr:AAA family ATPase [Nitrososphaerota archaeon]
MSLSEAEFLGKDDERRLRTIGAVNVTDVAFASVGTISSAGFPPVKSKQIAENACSSLPSTHRGSSLTGRRKLRGKISTGCRLLDSALSGGICTGRVTDVYGASGVGKTQLCLQLCVNVQKLRSGKGEQLAAIYVDTAATFRPERLVEMAQSAGMEGEGVLKKVYAYSARSLERQVSLPRMIQEVSRRLPLGLVIIDTLTENFIYQSSAELPLLQRQLLLAKHLHELSDLAVERNLAVVVTNGVRALVEQGGVEVEVGGSATRYGPHLHLRLQRIQGRRIATVMRPPFQQVCLNIGTGGIIDC